MQASCFNPELEESLDIAFAVRKEVIMLRNMNVNFMPSHRCQEDSRNVNVTQIIKDPTRTTIVKL